MPARSTRRAGLSLIEVLAVLTIIAVILSLMLPAVARSREGARRSGCINNLRQLGLALHNYEGTFLVLPSGDIDRAGPIVDGPDGRRLGWLVQILPFMDQGYLAVAVDTRLSVFALENTTVALTQISSLACPSDPYHPAPGVRAQSSYAGCHHDVEAPIDVDNHGVFYLNSRVSHAGLYDGSFCTIFVGECRRDPSDQSGWMAGTRATLRNTGTMLNAPIQKLPSVVGGFGSYHPDGANFSFGDGSVRFLTESIQPTIYQFLGHRDDGEIINETDMH